jgi:hypothetical protein
LFNALHRVNFLSIVHFHMDLPRNYMLKREFGG